MKVLVAIDDSHYSHHVVDAICRRRWAPDTEFKIVHVLEPLSMSDWSTESGWKEMQQDIVHRRKNFAEKLCADARHKIENHVPGSIVHFEIREGNPQAQIVRAASEWEASKILIGAHSRDVCPHNLLGGVSRSVAERSQCSVEIVRTPAARHKKQEHEKSSTATSK